MTASIEQRIATEAGYAEQLIEHFSQLQRQQKIRMNQGLPPEEYKTCEALVNAIDAAVRIVKKTKTNTLSTTD